jgi:hypothetical protein
MPEVVNAQPSLEDLHVDDANELWSLIAYGDDPLDEPISMGRSLARIRPVTDS